MLAEFMGGLVFVRAFYIFRSPWPASQKFFFNLAVHFCFFFVLNENVENIQIDNSLMGRSEEVV